VAYEFWNKNLAQYPLVIALYRIKELSNYLPPSPAFLGENKSQSQLNTLPPRFRTVEIPA